MNECGSSGDGWEHVLATHDARGHNNIMGIIAKKQKDVLVTGRNERPVVSVKQWGMARLKMEGNSMVIEALDRRELLNVNNGAMVEFYINLDIALKFELVLAKSGLNNTIKYELGPNLQHTLPSSTYNEHTMPTGGNFRTYYNWEGPQYTGVNYVNEPCQVVTKEGVTFLRLHLSFEW